MNNIRYADDTVLIAENENDLKKILLVVNEVSNTYGLKINIAKTKFIVMSRSNEENHLEPVNVSINGNEVYKFSHLYEVYHKSSRTLLSA